MEGQTMQWSNEKKTKVQILHRKPITSVYKYATLVFCVVFVLLSFFRLIIVLSVLPFRLLLIINMPHTEKQSALAYL
jgi:hypothetical protein